MFLQYTCDTMGSMLEVHVPPYGEQLCKLGAYYSYRCLHVPVLAHINKKTSTLGFNKGIKNLKKTASNK